MTPNPAGTRFERMTKHYSPNRDQLEEIEQKTGIGRHRSSFVHLR